MCLQVSAVTVRSQDIYDRDSISLLAAFALFSLAVGTLQPVVQSFGQQDLQTLQYKPVCCKFLDEFNNGNISKIRQHLPKLWAKV